MKKIIIFAKKHWPYFILLTIVIALFYKTLIFGRIPFPGDLMLSEYAPFRHTEYFGYAAGGVPNKGQYFDVARELYPWKTLVIEALKQNALPLWNPYSFSGTPLLANYQSQTLYPLGLLYLLFPQQIAWTILVLLQVALGMVFMYLFAHEIGLSKYAAILSAITFNLSSFASSWIEFNTVWHTILWLPLLLYIIERAVSQKKLSLGQQLLFVFSLFSAITAGHPQDFINTFLFLSIYIIIRITTLKDKKVKEKISFFLKQFGYILVIPFFLAAIQLFSTIELYTISSRVPHNLSNILSTMLIHIWQLPLLIYQDFFGNPATRTYSIPDTYVGKTLSIGVVGFVLSVWSFFIKKKSWHWVFFAITSGIILCISISSPITALLYQFPIPILSTGTPTRNLFILMLSLSILAGFGLDAITKEKHRTKHYIVTAFSIILVAWIAALLLPMFYPFILPSLVKRSALIISALIVGTMFFVLISGYRSFLLKGIVLLSVIELGYGFIKFNPFVPKTFMYPSNAVFDFLTKNAGYYRFWGYGTARFESNLNAQYKLFSTDGTDPLNIKWYNQFIQASKDGYLARTFTNLTRSDAALAQGYGERDLPDNIYRLRIMDLLGVKYILDRPENPKDNTTFDTKRFIPVTTLSNQYTVFENTLVYPRAFLVGEYKTYNSIDSFEKEFFSDTFNPRQTLLLPEGVKDIPLGKTTSHSAVIASYTPMEVTVKTESDMPQLLFLSDAYAPGWVAYVDEIQTEVYRADYAFRAVQVPKGVHTVRFVYKPNSVTLGKIATLVGLLSLLTLIVLNKRKRI